MLRISTQELGTWGLYLTLMVWLGVWCVAHIISVTAQVTIGP